MRKLTITLDAKLAKALDQLAKSCFRNLRRKTLPFAEAQSLLTDEDVFRLLS